MQAENSLYNISYILNVFRYTTVFYFICQPQPENTDFDSIFSQHNLTKSV